MKYALGMVVALELKSIYMCVWWLPGTPFESDITLNLTLCKSAVTIWPSLHMNAKRTQPLCRYLHDIFQRGRMYSSIVHVRPQDDPNQRYPSSNAANPSRMVRLV